MGVEWEKDSVYNFQKKTAGNFGIALNVIWNIVLSGEYNIYIHSLPPQKNNKLICRVTTKQSGRFWFNDISTFVGYLMPKHVKEQ